MSAHWDRLRGRSSDPHEQERHDSAPLLWRLSEHDAQLYAAAIAVGVPILGYVLPGDGYAKTAIYAVFLALTHLYWYIELKEIIIQVKVFNSLKQEESDHQRGEMRSLYWGTLVAVLAWAFPATVYLATWKWAEKPVWMGPTYGIADILIIAHTAVIGAIAINALSAIISIIQESLATQRRLEERSHS
ncbi:hypothetical protein K8R03_02570 [Candidatus Kaiserbacteria bacterium]|nr:hypothetical protein [Candidatus Kaiserbacteria bacterium]